MESTKKSPSGQEAARQWLVTEQPLDFGTVSECLYASTMTAWSHTLGCSVVMAVTCKQWKCRFCGGAKVRRLAAITREAKPTTLITLTVNPALHDDPRSAWNKVQPAVPRLVQRIRKKVGEFEYLRVLEITKKGWPHFHFVARTSFMPQSWLSQEWCQLTGAPIVDIRKIKRTQDAYFYVVKYLSKQEYIPWTDRRVTLSRKFDLKPEKESKRTLGLEEVQRYMQSPARWCAWNLRGCTLESISPICWKIIKGPG